MFFSVWLVCPWTCTRAYKIQKSVAHLYLLWWQTVSSLFSLKLSRMSLLSSKSDQPDKQTKFLDAFSSAIVKGMEDSKAIRFCHCAVTPGRCWKLHLYTSRLVDVSPQTCFLLLSPLLFGPFIGLKCVTAHLWNMALFFFFKYFKVQIKVDYYCFVDYQTEKLLQCV